MKYKKAFAEKLGERLDKISDEKLEKIISKIDSVKTKVEENEKMSEDKKERLFAQLDAIKDLINEKLDKTSEDLDIDDLLDV
jgi:predicted KAP-like P-loop ATPase